MVAWTSGAGPPAARAPISVLIADFENTTGDSVFQGSLEQALGIAIEGAPFISAVSRQDAQRIAAGLKRGSAAPGDVALDTANARLVAARQGIQVILAGGIAQAPDGYTLSVRAFDAQSSDERVLARREAKASSKSGVLEAIGTLAAAMRRGLGETDLADDGTGETFTAGSIEAMRAYVRGQELNKAGRMQDALAAFKEAVTLDPSFGRAYVNMGAIYTNLKQDALAREHYDQALKLLDRMTPREQYRTQGVYYLGITRDYEKAIDSFSRLVREYPADNMGYGNLALAYLNVRDIAKAMEVGKRAIGMYPKNLLQRTNYATYALYAGDFATAIAEAQRVLDINQTYVFALLTRARATLAQGDVEAARAAYAAMAAIDAMGASMASLGEADLEMYFGRYTRALDVLEKGIASDEADKRETELAAKLIARAEALLATGDVARAASSADRAIKLSSHESVLYPGGRVLIAAGADGRAASIAETMSKALSPPTRCTAGCSPRRLRCDARIIRPPSTRRAAR